MNGGGEPIMKKTDIVFVATGRRANTDNVGLKEIGVQMDK